MSRSDIDEPCGGELMGVVGPRPALESAATELHAPVVGLQHGLAMVPLTETSLAWLKERERTSKPAFTFSVSRSELRAVLALPRDALHIVFGSSTPDWFLGIPKLVAWIRNASQDSTLVQLHYSSFKESYWREYAVVWRKGRIVWGPKGGPSHNVINRALCFLCDWQVAARDARKYVGLATGTVEPPAEPAEQPPPSRFVRWLRRRVARFFDVAVSQVRISSGRAFLKASAGSLWDLVAGWLQSSSTAVGRFLRPPKPPWRVEVRKFPGVAILDLPGDCFDDAQFDLAARVEELLASGERRILVNLCRNDRGLYAGHILARAYVSSHKAGAELGLIQVRPRMIELLRIYKVAALFPIYRDEAAALAGEPKNAESEN